MNKKLLWIHGDNTQIMPYVQVLQSRPDILVERAITLDDAIAKKISNYYAVLLNPFVAPGPQSLGKLLEWRGYGTPNEDVTALVMEYKPKQLIITDFANHKSAQYYFDLGAALYVNMNTIEPAQFKMEQALARQ